MHGCIVMNTKRRPRLSVTQVLPLALAALVVACGSSASVDESSDEGALKHDHCIDVGFLADCHSDIPVTKLNGWKLPTVVEIHTAEFDVPSQMLEHMKPLATNPNAVAAQVVTGPSNALGIVCTKSGIDARCSLDVLVEAASVVDPAGQPVKQTFSFHPVRFVVHGRVAKLLATLSPTAEVGPIKCSWSGESAQCEVLRDGLGAIVSLYTPNSDASKAAVEASMDPPSR